MNSLKEMTALTDVKDEEILMLGIASTDTQGGPLTGEDMGGFVTLGIAQD